MTPGLENHLISRNRFVEEDYVQVFDKEQVNIYDANNVEIKQPKEKCCEDDGCRRKDCGAFR